MPSFFVVGSARSGTTLLRLVMNAHPLVVVPPESRFIVDLWHGTEIVDVEAFLAELEHHRQFQTWKLPVDDVRALLPAGSVAYGRAIDAAYEAYARTRGKRVWGDKTPRYIEHIAFLARCFPKARFVHVVRDGRNVALSYADVPFGPKTVAGAAELWSRRVRAGLEAGRKLAGRYLELRYEHLVAGREGLEEQARRLCDFLQLSFDDAMLDYAEVSRAEMLDKARDLNPLLTRTPISEARSWRYQMPARHTEVFEAVAGDVLDDLGYERRFPRPAARARLVAALSRRRVPLGRLKSAR
jgi:hypothetical protein